MPGLLYLECCVHGNPPPHQQVVQNGTKRWTGGGTQMHQKAQPFMRQQKVGINIVQQPFQQGRHIQNTCDNIPRRAHPISWKSNNNNNNNNAFIFLWNRQWHNFQCFIFSKIKIKIVLSLEQCSGPRTTYTIHECFSSPGQPCTHDRCAISVDKLVYLPTLAHGLNYLVDILKIHWGTTYWLA